MKQTLFFFLVFSTFSCISSDSNLFEIDPRNFKENKITLGEIADDVMYIPIDNTYPLGIIYSYKIADNLIYLSAKGIGVIVFNRDGKFLKRIGKIGRGPGEYRYGMRFSIDEETGNVFVLDHDKVKVFSDSGNFIRDLMLNEDGWYDIELYHSLLFLPNTLAFGDSKYNWIFLDTLGNLVSRKVNSVSLFETSMEINGSFYKFGNKLFYYNYFNDTIFSISSNLKNEAAYSFAQGDFRWPKEGLELSDSKLNHQLSNLFRPRTMFETKHFIVLEYAYLDIYAYCLINKKSKKTFLALKYQEIPGAFVKSKACIINDLDGGLPLAYINYYIENDEEYITSFITPFDLKVYVLSDEFKNSVPRYPEKKKDVEKLANSLKDTDNPILMMVRLKK